MVDNKITLVQINQDDLVNKIIEGVSKIIINTSSSNGSHSLMTCKEVEKLFDISPPTRIEWTRRKILQSYKIGSRRFYKRHEVESALITVE